MKSIAGSTKRYIVYCIQFVALTLLASGAWALDLDQTVDFNIPKQKLDSALVQFSEQAKIQISSSSDQVKDFSTDGIEGRYKVSIALKTLLQRTGLSYKPIGQSAISIGKFAADSAANSSKEAGNSSSQDFRVAQGPAPGDSSVKKEKDKEASTKNSDLEEIVVTGTLIAGSAPVGASVTVYTRQDIEQSGAATLEQFARLIPNNFSGADTIALGNNNAGLGVFSQGSQEGTYAGASFNLHGLGPNSTLTLLNGHRLAGGGADGSLTDISMIPLSAIERIEVLDDGASAIYGSDAVAGVVNIITRKNFDGAETTVLYGRATDGGDSTVSASQVVGKAWSSGNALLSYEYNDQGGLDASQRDYIGSQGGADALVPQNRRNSLFVSGSQNAGDATTLFFTVLYSKRNFNTNYTINTPSSYTSEGTSGDAEQSDVTLSLDQALLGDWHVSVTGNYSRIQQSYFIPLNYDYPAYGISGSLTIAGEADTKTTGADALASGSLFQLGGSNVKAALGASFRTEQFDSNQVEGTGAGTTPSVIGAATQRHVSSAYGEVAVPIIGEGASKSWTYSLSLSAAERYDRYSDFGSTSNDKFGLAWVPIRGFTVRGTYGTSFQAPLLENLNSPITSYAQQEPNPAAPGGFTDAILVEGGNPALRPQTAKSASAGFDFIPVAVPEWSVSSTWFHTVFTNRIQLPPVTSASLFSQPLLAPFIVNSPPLSLVESYFNSPGFSNDSGQGPAAVQAIIDQRLANIASITESGFDVSTRYSQKTSYGVFEFSASGTRLLNERFKSVAAAPAFELINTVAEPTAWKARGGLSWALGGLTSALNINYVNRYNNNLQVTQQQIASWTTEDLYLGYHFANSSPVFLLRDLNLAFSILNLTNRQPPYLQIPPALSLGQNPLPYDATNASPVGRFISLQLTKRWY